MPGPPSPAAIQLAVEALSKRFGPLLAVDCLTFTARPGRVTGFLGPNGAGKTTTLRMLLGLAAPTSGRATIGGRRYVDLEQPSRVVGAALDSSGFHPGRRAGDHLLVLARQGGLARERVEVALQQVGLLPVADRRVGGFSLGMRQRLALAGALLGDPRVLVLDEPTNGLDPEGVAWLRGFLRHLAGEGRTILLSSHLLAEVTQTVDDVVILRQGRLVAEAPLAELVAARADALVRTPDPERLRRVLAEAGQQVMIEGKLLRVVGSDPALVGHLALVAGVELHELRRDAADLERVFLGLTGDLAEASGGSS